MTSCLESRHVMHCNAKLPGTTESEKIINSQNKTLSPWSTKSKANLRNKGWQPHSTAQQGQPDPQLKQNYNVFTWKSRQNSELEGSWHCRCRAVSENELRRKTFPFPPLPQTCIQLPPISKLQMYTIAQIYRVFRDYSPPPPTCSHASHYS